MVDRISVDLNDQESLYLTALEISTYSQEIITLICAVSTNLDTLSSQGYFHERMSPSSEEGDGMARYILKAQEFATLCEVTAGHIQNTYQSMLNTDRVLAVYVLNLMLSSPETDAAKKEEILNNQEAYVAAVEESLKEGE